MKLRYPPKFYRNTAIDQISSYSLAGTHRQFHRNSKKLNSKAKRITKKKSHLVGERKSTLLLLQLLGALLVLQQPSRVLLHSATKKKVQHKCERILGYNGSTAESFDKWNITLCVVGGRGSRGDLTQCEFYICKSYGGGWLWLIRARGIVLLRYFGGLICG